MGITIPFAVLSFLFGMKPKGKPRGVGTSAMYKFTGPDTILSSGIIIAFLSLK